MESNAQGEVDYVNRRGEKTYPIEVKASSFGSMQSIHKFIELKKCDFGFRISLESFSSYSRF